ncbi:hypothetical protein BX661DRAFT_177803 [Kickxella alabastrina]|uniref:uncharacterized protein n=1 Tax=Kickxella alabastrina TaxID=61397 RepID=UPI00221EF9D2|nr:uncharacterized protein BX661DRAFT_177803 [Kickxella alabastrina]KAI7833915.1 hypothetical protein BX661DRAFT_177803 [Kickxella alabastrina]
MHSNLSQFQTLHCDIINSIVAYLIDLSEARDFDKIDEVGDSHEIILSAGIMQCCHAWRIVILERLCHEVTLEYLSDGKPGGWHFKFWPYPICAPSFPINHLVKKVVVVVCNWPFLSDRQSLRIIKPRQPNLVFLNAHTLTVVLTECRNDKFSDTYMSERKASKFAKDIRQIVPEISKIAIKSLYPHYRANQQQSGDHLLGRFCFDLCQGVSQVSVYSPFLKWSINLRPEWWVALGCYNHIAVINHCAVFELIRQNAGTLQSLELHLRNLQERRDLLFDCTGRAMVYPALEKLVISDFIGPADSHPADLDRVVPFPNLKIIKTFSLTHNDSYMFRGNHDTLESLSMSLNTGSLRVYDQWGTFAAVKYPRLRHFSLTVPIIEGHNAESQAVASRFAINILKAAQSSVRTLVLLRKGFDKHLLCADIQSAAWTSGIQSLILPHTGFSFTDILHLLKHLPALQALHSQIELSTHTSNNDNSDNQAGDYFNSPVDVIYNTHYPLGNCFSSWNILGEGDEYNLNVERFVALVAILCPNFTHSFAYSRIVSNFRVVSRCPVVPEGFELHKERLKQVKFLDINIKKYLYFK